MRFSESRQVETALHEYTRDLSTAIEAVEETQRALLGAFDRTDSESLGQ